MGFISKEASVATWYRVLPRLQLGLFTITSSPRKFAEGVVLQCHSASHLTCFVSFHRVHPSYATTQSYNSSTVHTVRQITFVHTFMQLYIHTLLLSHINAYTTYKQYQSIHGCISHQNLFSAISLQISLYLSLYQSGQS